MDPMKDIYQSYAESAEQQFLEKFVITYLKSRLESKNFTDKQIDYLWKIVDDFVKDAYSQGFEKDHSSMLGTLKTECKNVISHIKELFSEEKVELPEKFEEDSHERLYQRMIKEILKGNLNKEELETDGNSEKKILSSPECDEAFYSLRLNQYLYSLGICDEQFHIKFDNGSLDYAVDTRNEKAQKEMLETTIKEIDSAKKMFPFIVQAFDSPMCSQEEKDLVKLTAVEIFLQALDGLTKYRPDIEILRAAYFSFYQIRELKCHIHITKYTILLKELESYK